MKVLKGLLALLVLAGLVACNTIEGVGEDIEAAGDKIEKEAGKHKGY
ncbi:MAG: entericidin A/B family lipoprotein [Chromatiales bacterium]|jgi:entericidin B